MRTPNENYSRELMELFTMGPEAFTEDDVRAGAKALSGWREPRTQAMIDADAQRELLARADGALHDGTRGVHRGRRARRREGALRMARAAHAGDDRCGRQTAADAHRSAPADRAEGRHGEDRHLRAAAWLPRRGV